jgi:uncharacterized RDD family membrane protein YckC/ribosomal protein L40E
MLCVRCSHPLPPRADRCVRCFALNPPQAAAPRAALGIDLTSDPPSAMSAPGGLSIESEPPPPAQLSISSAPPTSGRFQFVRTEPPPLRVQPEPTAREQMAAADDAETRPFASPRNLELPFVTPRPAQDEIPAAVSTPVAPAISVPSSAPGLEAENPAASLPATGPAFARAGSRLAAWSIDFGLLFLLLCGQILLTAVSTRHGFLDLVLSRPLLPFWIVLGACDALTCSWLFAALGRTPGMAFQRQRLLTLGGSRPTPGAALQRALLSLLSAAPALFGFSLALFDARGQTLHDKLCGCIVTID